MTIVSSCLRHVYNEERQGRERVARRLKGSSSLKDTWIPLLLGTITENRSGLVRKQFGAGPLLKCSRSFEMVT